MGVEPDTPVPERVTGWEALQRLQGLLFFYEIFNLYYGQHVQTNNNQEVDNYEEL